MNNHGLTSQQLKIICSILIPYADKIEQVGLFGSRATGNFRNNSDIDIVLYGDVDEVIIHRLYTLFMESSLAIKVDINAYNLVAYPPLKEHIDNNVKTLFTKQDLLTN